MIPWFGNIANKIKFFFEIIFREKNLDNKLFPNSRPSRDWVEAIERYYTEQICGGKKAAQAVKGQQQSSANRCCANGFGCDQQGQTKLGQFKQ